jgi:hypothetical protein
MPESIEALLCGSVGYKVLVLCISRTQKNTIFRVQTSFITYCKVTWHKIISENKMVCISNSRAGYTSRKQGGNR